MPTAFPAALGTPAFPIASLPPPPADEPGQLPDPPINPGATIPVSSPQTISGLVTDKVFEITAPMATAFTFQPGATLRRCTINIDGVNVTTVLTGPGTAEHVGIYGLAGGGTMAATPHPFEGFRSVQRFVGTCYAKHCNRGIQLTGTAIECPAGSMIRGDFCSEWGVLIRELFDSQILGRIQGDNSDHPFGAATGVETWTNVRRNYFADMRGFNNDGYAVAIADFATGGGSVTDNEIGTIIGSGADDPGTTITQGVKRLKIGYFEMSDTTFGMTIGEDNPTLNEDIEIDHFVARNCGWGGLRTERIDGLIVRRIDLIDIDTTDTALGQGAVHCRTGSLNVEISNLNHIGPNQQTDYGVFVASGCTGFVRGASSGWSIARVSNASGAGFDTSQIL